MPLTVLIFLIILLRAAVSVMPSTRNPENMPSCDSMEMLRRATSFSLLIIDEIFVTMLMSSLPTIRSVAAN